MPPATTPPRWLKRWRRLAIGTVAVLRRAIRASAMLTQLSATPVMRTLSFTMLGMDGLLNRTTSHLKTHLDNIAAEKTRKDPKTAHQKEVSKARCDHLKPNGDTALQKYGGSYGRCVACTVCSSRWRFNKETNQWEAWPRKDEASSSSSLPLPLPSALFSTPSEASSKAVSSKSTKAAAKSSAASASSRQPQPPHPPPVVLPRGDAMSDDSQAEEVPVMQVPTGTAVYDLPAGDPLEEDWELTEAEDH